MASLDGGPRRALAAIARTPRQLVACDYDGTSVRRRPPGQEADFRLCTTLLLEQYGPIAVRSPGDHLQACSHVDLIRCAQLLDGPDPG